MRNTVLVIGGTSLADFGCKVSAHGALTLPEPRVETVELPGRNGLLTFDDGTYNNVTASYTVYFPRHLRPRLDALRAFLLADRGYRRIEDSYFPDVYRMGRYLGGSSVVASQQLKQGYLTIEFDCKPQRYLKMGEMAKRFTAGGTIYNPTEFTALPLIKCKGTSGTITIDGVSVQVTGCAQYADIDCELMEVYEGSTNRNGTTTLTNGAFPVLKPGAVSISFTGFSWVEITPRWWTL